MKIFINYNNKLIEIDNIEENNSIEKLKKEIEERIKIKKEYQIIKNKEDDFLYEKTIKENNIKDEEILYLINLNEEEVEEVSYNKSYCGKNFFFNNY
jgi:hypothetical protein